MNTQSNQIEYFNCSDYYGESALIGTIHPTRYKDPMRKKSNLPGMPPRYELTKEQVRDIVLKFKSGIRGRHIAIENHIPYNLVWRIISGKTYANWTLGMLSGIEKQYKFRNTSPEKTD